MKKIKLFIIAFTFSIITAKAQWTGPSTGGVGILSTNNQVNIAGVVVSGLPGSPPQPAMFNVFTNTGSAFDLKFSVDHNRVDANTSLFVNSGSIFVTRRGSSAGNTFSVGQNGTMTLNTTGIIHPTIGFFINSNNRNFFTVTESQILFKDATQDLFKVNANGYLSARKVIVTLQNPYADYVFDKNYKLKTLTELEAFIAKYHHLPNVPSLAEVEANNKQIDVGEMQVILLEKVEELTLYILQQQKEIEALKAKLAE